ncbi:unnamed protein product [Effrenium voratum]|nr:unnamed protein product [Effrenium voratum]
MKGYHSCDGPAELVTVGQVLDGMPFGFFHMTHIAWALAAIAVLAIQYEMTPYMFPGLQLHFGADREELSTFAAAFQAGCAFGTMMAPALADRMGRKPTLIFSITLCATLSYASALSKSLHMLMVLRTLSSASWAIGWNALSPWYVEFLPTKTRGAMLTALSLGWPIGRGTVILWSQLLGSDWQQLMKLQAIAMMVLMAGTSLINESPMYLAYRGRLQEARRVLDAVHRSNGSQWRSDCQLCLDDTGTNTVDERTWQELLSPEYRSRTAFCWILFALLSGTTILIDTWGPIIFQHLIFPGHTELPRGLLMLFNIGDLIGLVVSVFVIDRIGRKGGFVIGKTMGKQTVLRLTEVKRQNFGCLYVLLRELNDGVHGLCEHRGDVLPFNKAEQVAPAWTRLGVLHAPRPSRSCSSRPAAISRGRRVHPHQEQNDQHEGERREQLHQGRVLIRSFLLGMDEDCVRLGCGNLGFAFNLGFPKTLLQLLDSVLHQHVDVLGVGDGHWGLLILRSLIHARIIIVIFIVGSSLPAARSFDPAVRVVGLRRVHCATTFGGARVCLQAIMGMTATGCRGFAWEGATMWALEAFPTSLRAAALCSSRVCMQVMAVFTLKVSAEYLAFYSASQWLQIFGVLLIMAGGVVVVLNPRETAGVPLAEGSDRDATIPAAAVEACGRAGQPVADFLAGPLDSDLGLQVLKSLRDLSFWQDAMQVLARMRGQRLALGADHFVEAMAACDPGCRERVLGSPEGATSRPLEVIRLFAAAKAFGVEGSTRFYQAALGGSCFWAWALYVLDDMEANGFAPEAEDLNVLLKALATAQPEEPRQRTAQQTAAARARKVLRAKTEPPSKGVRPSRVKHSPVVVWDSPQPRAPPQFLDETAQALAPAEMRRNEPYVGGPFRKWQMALSMLQKFDAYGISAETDSFNHIISACTRAQELAPCRGLLDMMRGQGVPLNTVTCDRLIGGCCEKGLWEQALLLLDRAKFLQLAGGSTFQQGLKACARGRQPRLAIALLDEMDRGGSAEGVTGAALDAAMATCAKCHLWVQVLALLHQLKRRNLGTRPATYAAAVESYAGSGPWENALELLEEAKSCSQADGRVFAGAVAACGDRWQLILSAVVSMRELRIAPERDTYSDLLRSFQLVGRSAEAAMFLEAPLVEEERIGEPKAAEEKGGRAHDVAMHCGTGVTSEAVDLGWLADKTCNSKTSACALRHPATGEAAPVGDRYNKEPIPDEDWWLRGNNRAKLLTTAPFTFYDGNPLGKKNFQAQCVGPDHSRRVAQQLGRIGHSFSEANLQVLKEDPTARRYMSHRYAELMGSVGHCSRSTPWLPGTERLERRPKASAYAPANNAPSAPANAPNAANAAKLPTVKLPKAEMRRTMDGSTIVVLQKGGGAALWPGQRELTALP